MAFTFARSHYNLTTERYIYIYIYEWKKYIYNRVNVVRVQLNPTLFSFFPWYYLSHSLHLIMTYSLVCMSLISTCLNVAILIWSVACTVQQSPWWAGLSFNQLPFLINANVMKINFVADSSIIPRNLASLINYLAFLGIISLLLLLYVNPVMTLHEMHTSLVLHVFWTPKPNFGAGCRIFSVLSYKYEINTRSGIKLASWQDQLLLKLCSLITNSILMKIADSPFS